jgi:hypothetical protein
VEDGGILDDRLIGRAGDHGIFRRRFCQLLHGGLLLEACQGFRGNLRDHGGQPSGTVDGWILFQVVCFEGFFPPKNNPRPILSGWGGDF